MFKFKKNGFNKIISCLLVLAFVMLSVPVTVLADTSPIAQITGPIIADTGRGVTIRCSSTISVGTISRRTWSVSPIAGQSNTLSGTGGNITFTTPGIYTITLVVTDSAGVTSTDTHVITASPPNVRPVALITGATRGFTNTPVALTCASTDRDGTIVSRSWRISPATGHTNTLAETGGNIIFTASGMYTITLVVTDNQGATTTDTHTVSVFVPVNPPPVARILGSTASNVGRTITVACGSTDSNGTIVSRAWRVSPTTGQVNTLSETGGTVSFSAPGRYTLFLTIVDNDGATRTDTHLVTVRGVADSAFNLFPIASIAGPTTTITGNTINLTCTSIDKDGVIVSRAWSIGPTTGHPNTLIGAGGTVTFLVPGVYAINLTVTDNRGATDTAVHIVTAINPAPEVIITGPANVLVDETITLACESTDSNGTIASREWIINPKQGFTSTLINTGGNIIFSLPGVYTVTLNVTDNKGAVGTNIRTITVTNPEPVALITGVTTTMTGETISLACESTDSNGSIVSREWTISPTAGQTNTLSETGGNITFSAPGVYTVTLNVTDNHGATTTDTHEIEVNSAPKAVVTSPTTAGTSGTITITCESTDDDGTIVSREWIISPQTGQTNTLTGTGGDITFTAPGVYTITLVVTDNRGAVVTHTHTITVVPNNLPTAQISAPTTARVDRPVSIACASIDSDGFIVSRVWSISPEAGQTNTLSETGGNITFTEPGVYTVTLTVVDHHGARNIATRTITAVTHNYPPAALITGPTVAGTGGTIELVCASTDSDGTIASRSWSVSPSTGQTNTLTGTGGRITFTTLGVYTITLTVTDNDGVTATDTHTVNVTQRPTVLITGPTSAISGVGFIDLGASASTGGGTALNFHWSISPAISTGATHLSGLRIINPVTGVYTATVTVSNNLGTATDTHVITITNPAPLPIIVGESTAVAGVPVEIACASVDSNGTITSREWSVSPAIGQTNTLTGTGGTITFTEVGTYRVALLIRDGDGATATGVHTVTVLPPPPVETITGPAIASLNETIPLVSVLSQGSGTIVSRAWSVSPATGHTNTLTGTGGNISFTSEGTYTITMTATDSRGITSSDTHTVRIVAPNVPPVALITGPTTAGGGGTITLTCASTDRDGTIASRVWSVNPTAGQTNTLTGTGGNITFSVVGTFTVSLVVTDDTGAISEDTHVIVVSASTPTLTILGPSTAFIGVPTTFSVRQTSGDWSAGSRSIAAVSPSAPISGNLDTVTFPTPGIYTVTFQVGNASQRIIHVTHTVTVSNPIPKARIAGSTVVVTGREITLNCASFDLNGSITSRTWSVSPATGQTNTLTGTGGRIAFTAPGVYTATLTVTDNHGATNVDTHTITVMANIPPMALIRGGTEAGVNGVVSLTCGSTDSNGSIAVRTWSVSPIAGQSNTLSGTGGNITFTSQGVYTVTLTVTDNNGATAIDAHTIIVGSQNIAPRAVITGPSYGRSIGGTGQNVTLTCASTDSDGEIVDRVWSISGIGTRTGTSVTFPACTTRGYRNITLTVTDNNGRTATTSHFVDTFRTHPPFASLSGPTRAYVGERLVLNHTAFDIDGQLREEGVSASPSTGVSLVSTANTSTLTFSIPGVYTITYFVQDNRNGSRTVTHTITVTLPEPRALISGPTTAIAGQPISLICASVDHNSAIVSRAWSVAPTVGQTNALTGTGGNITFSAPGVYTVTLIVTNSRGVISTAKHNVRVE